MSTSPIPVSANSGKKDADSCAGYHEADRHTFNSPADQAVADALFDHINALGAITSDTNRPGGQVGPLSRPTPPELRLRQPADFARLHSRQGVDRQEWIERSCTI